MTTACHFYYLRSFLYELGLTTSQAITIFLKRVKREKGIPFDLKISKEYQIATDISNALKDISNNQTKDINELLDEL
jgi:addiction module RelB/DinJ family antitoxin